MQPQMRVKMVPEQQRRSEGRSRLHFQILSLDAWGKHEQETPWVPCPGERMARDGQSDAEAAEQPRSPHDVRQTTGFGFLSTCFPGRLIKQPRQDGFGHPI